MPQRIEVPGQGIVEFPDGMSDADIAKAIQSSMAPSAPSQQSQSGGIGQMLGDLAAGGIRGAGSIGATLLAPIDYAASKLNDGKPVDVGLGVQLGIDRRPSMDQALRTMGADPESMAFKTGKVGAEIAGTSGVGGVLANTVGRFAPGATGLIEALRTGGMSANNVSGLGGLALRTTGGALTGGASAGLVNPEDAGTGAIVGGAIPGSVALAGSAGRALGRGLRPSDEVAQIAQKAKQYNIPIGYGDIVENKAVQAARSILKDAPLTGSMAQGAQDAKQKAFNRAVGQTFGADAPSLTVDVVDRARSRMGAEFDRIWNNNSLKVTPEFAAKLSELKQLSAKLPRNEGASLAAEIDDLATKVVQASDGTQEIPGAVANKFQQYLRRRAEGSAGLRNELGDMRQAIIGAFNQSVSPADAAALTANRAQYKAFKTVEPLLRNAELGVAGRMPGDVPAALLPGAVSKSYSRTAGVPLADLAQVGSRFLVDRTPQTGGSARAALQNTAIGAALAGGGMANPAAAAMAIPGAIGVQSMLNSQGLANAALSPSGQVNQNLIRALRAAQLAAPVVSAQ